MTKHYMVYAHRFDLSALIWSMVPVMGNVCCSEEEEEVAEEEEESSTFAYVNTNTRIFEGSFLAFLAPLIIKTSLGKYLLILRLNLFVLKYPDILFFNLQMMASSSGL
jgi:hypothetical protein